MRKSLIFSMFVLSSFVIHIDTAQSPRIYSRKTKDTLTAIEMDIGEALKFTLRNGQTRTLSLQQTIARIPIINLKQLKKGFSGGGTIYEFNVRVRHRKGREVLRVMPLESRLIGTYEFEERPGGSVTILAGAATGPVVADAVVFRRTGIK